MCTLCKGRPSDKYPSHNSHIFSYVDNQVVNVHAKVQKLLLSFKLSYKLFYIPKYESALDVRTEKIVYIVIDILLW